MRAAVLLFPGLNRENDAMRALRIENAVFQGDDDTCFHAIDPE